MKIMSMEMKGGCLLCDVMLREQGKQSGAGSPRSDVILLGVAMSSVCVEGVACKLSCFAVRQTFRSQAKFPYPTIFKRHSFLHHSIMKLLSLLRAETVMFVSLRG